MIIPTPLFNMSDLFNTNAVVVRGDINLREALKCKLPDEDKCREVIRFVSDVRQTLIDQMSRRLKSNVTYLYPVYKLLDKPNGFELHVVTPARTAILFIKY